jgi:hypothetical protein|tara:strand:+ start:2125 stop:2679 length:555 start_codon:yes stop_codon:yes gene_type:complete
MPFQSPLVEILYRSNALWSDKDFEIEVSASDIAKMRVAAVSGVCGGFCSAITTKPIFIDKHWCWAWNSNMELADEITPNIRVLRTWRDPSEIRKSFDKCGFDYSEDRLQEILAAHSGAVEVDNYRVLSINFEEIQDDILGVMSQIEAWFNLSEYDYDIEKPSVNSVITDRILGSTTLHELRGFA